MKTAKFKLQSLLILPLFLTASLSWVSADIVPRFDAGATPADIQGMVDIFKVDLGGVDNGVGGGPFSSGYRTITWDDVADVNATPGFLDADYFNVASPRGVVLSTPGSGFQVSASSTSGSALRFGNIDGSYASTFQAFSEERLFTPIDSIITDVNFFVPGDPSTPAYVSGFGAVFADVGPDLDTSITFFDVGGTELNTIFALGSPSGGLYFLGATFTDNQQIGSVRITSGNAALGNGIVDGGSVDLVVMDNFYYGEPLAVPEPSALSMLGLAALAALAFQFLRRRHRY